MAYFDTVRALKEDRVDDGSRKVGSAEADYGLDGFGPAADRRRRLFQMVGWGPEPAVYD